MQILIQSCHSVKIDLGERPPLDDPTSPCIECLPKVVSDFVGEQSRVHIMPISAKWKHKSSIHIGSIVFNTGVTTFFAKSVYCFDIRMKRESSKLINFCTPALYKMVIEPLPKYINR